MLEKTLVPQHEDNRLKALDIAIGNVIDNLFYKLSKRQIAKRFPKLSKKEIDERFPKLSKKEIAKRFPKLSKKEIDERFPKLYTKEIDKHFYDISNLSKLSKLSKIQEVMDFDKASNSPYLDAFAKMFGVEYWRVGWNDERKRAFLKEFRKLKRHAGTKGVIQAILDIFIGTTGTATTGARIIEWFEENVEGLDKGNIRILVPSSFSSKLADDNIVLRGLIDIYKPVHVGYDLRIPTSIIAGLCIAVIGGRKESLALETIDTNAIKLVFMSTIVAIITTKEVVHCE